MKINFDSNGNYIGDEDRQKDPDEVVTELAKQLQERRPSLKFRQAVQETLKANPKLAESYRNQFL